MRKYEGKMALNYDKDRANNSKYLWQQQTIESILRSFRPKAVMDVPVGTGRFFPVYKEIGCEVLGVDVSQDMLDIADDKGFGFPLIKADVFTIDLWDFVVCTRFFGHMRPNQKIQLLSKVADTMVLSHGPDGYLYFPASGLMIVGTHKMPENDIYVSILKRK